jgi:transcriptional regulator with XRE-family HTH domain
LRRFRDHPEPKSANSLGEPAGKETEGLLGRRHVRVLTIRLIGKETNLLEQQEKGVALTDPQAVYSYEMELELLRVHLEEGSVSIRELAERSGVSQKMLRDVREGKRRLSARRLEAAIEALGELLDG